MHHPTRIHLPDAGFDIGNGVEHDIGTVDWDEVVAADVAKIVLVLLAALSVDPRGGLDHAEKDGRDLIFRPEVRDSQSKVLGREVPVALFDVSRRWAVISASGKGKYCRNEKGVTVHAVTLKRALSFSKAGTGVRSIGAIPGPGINSWASSARLNSRAGR